MDVHFHSSIIPSLAVGLRTPIDRFFLQLSVKIMPLAKTSVFIILINRATIKTSEVGTKLMQFSIKKAIPLQALTGP